MAVRIHYAGVVRAFFQQGFPYRFGRAAHVAAVRLYRRNGRYAQKVEQFGEHFLAVIADVSFKVFHFVLCFSLFYAMCIINKFRKKCRLSHFYVLYFCTCVTNVVSKYKKEVAIKLCRVKIFSK